MQPQARLVEPSDVDDLVDHVLQTLCVAVDAEYAVVDRRSDVLPHEQYLDLSHDERQRRAEFVGCVHGVQVCLPTVTVLQKSLLMRTMSTLLIIMVQYIMEI